MRSWTVLGVFTLMAGAAASPQATAASPDFCRDYARTAIRQSEFARENPYCARHAHGSRWSMDFRQHFDWCLGVHHRTAEGETAARHEYLRACRGRY